MYYRFLETRDEYFPYWTGAELVGETGRWRVGLSDAVLRQIYYATAVRIIGRLASVVHHALRAGGEPQVAVHWALGMAPHGILPERSRWTMPLSL